MSEERQRADTERAKAQWFEENVLTAKDAQYAEFVRGSDGTWEYIRGGRKPITAADLIDEVRPCADLHGDEISECSWCGSLRQSGGQADA